MVFQYRPERQAYTDGAGRTVPEVQLRAAVERVAAAAADNLEDLTRRYQAGALGLAGWRGAMAAEIKLAHLSIGMAAGGGRAQLTPADWGHLGQTLKGEYRYLAGFAASLADESAGSEAQQLARARLYAASARLTFERVRARGAAAAGFDEERNVLGARESCAECPALSARGWVKAGTLPPVGARVCAMNCHCRIESRRRARQRREAA